MASTLVSFGSVWQQQLPYAEQLAGSLLEELSMLVQGQARTQGAARKFLSLLRTLLAVVKGSGVALLQRTPGQPGIALEEGPSGDARPCGGGAALAAASYAANSIMACTT